MKIRELEDKIIELSNRVEKLEKEKTQKHKFKVGDRVQFKSWQEMEREFTSPWFWGSSTYFLLPGDFIFGQSMKYLCGTYATIKEITSDGKVILTDSTSNQGNIYDWKYSPDMLKPAVNEPKQDTKWQKLKEFISNRSACAGYVVQVRLIWDILEKMQELEGEDE